MGRWVVGLEELDLVEAVGGKGAQLARLARLDGVRVPPGFCVTTEAYRAVCAEVPGLERRLAALGRVSDLGGAASLAAELRAALADTPVPDAVAAEIGAAVVARGEGIAWAVRSSATDEDLPASSSAGLYDSFLHRVGAAAVVLGVRSCWASAFTDRAVAARQRAGAPHDRVAMGVVVQQLVAPQVAGVLFTAHPVHGDRTVTSIEATWGLGESLVGGLVTPDVYEVRAGRITRRSIGEKQVVVEVAPEGGTRRVPVDPDRARTATLGDEVVLQLEALGRRVEAAFGCPVDLEWCLADGLLHLVQARPITTLFPIPSGPPGPGRVYLSVGHQQMMTDPMKPLGRSLFQLTALRPMFEAAGRLFVDVTQGLASPARQGLLEVFGRGDPLVRDALDTLLARAEGPPAPPAPTGAPAGFPPIPEVAPAEVEALVRRGRDSVAAAARSIGAATGPERFDRIVEDIDALKRLLLDPPSAEVILSAMQAAWWLDDQLYAWLGVKGAAGPLTRSVPGNVTSEMGLALLEVADVVREHPEVVGWLRRVTDDPFLDALPAVAGGEVVRRAITGWLEAYGARCVGEIDVTRPRWAERPSTLLPVLLGHVDRFEPGEAQRRFAQGQREARAWELELLTRLRALPDGNDKAAAAEARIAHLRAFIGYREHPKAVLVSRFFVYKQALLDEARRLVRAGVLREEEDAFSLTFDELRDLARGGALDGALIRERRSAHERHRALTPPRVITSDGECVTGVYRRGDVPPGALVGLPVSAGVVEGRARVVVELAGARLEAGDILVTRFTDPSWTPAFVSVAGLVTEVGGQMTHGSVIAREYGLPAVVGVEAATERIRDGQRIRVNGAEGWVELV